MHIRLLVILFLFTPLFTQAQVKYQRQQIVDDARHELGRPYHYGGELPSGFDCSGLVQYVFGNNGIALPRTSSEQSNFARREKIRNLLPGDLIFFGSGGQVNHVGIVQANQSGRLMMIHSGSSTGVTLTDVYASNYWSKRIKFGGVVLSKDDLLAVESRRTRRSGSGSKNTRKSKSDRVTSSGSSKGNTFKPKPERRRSGSTFSAEDVRRWRDKQQQRMLRSKERRKARKAKRLARKKRRG